MIHIFPDGSYSHTDQLGSWGCVVVTKARSAILYGTESNSSLDRCELLPIIAGLRWIRKNIPSNRDVHATIISDSESTVRLLSDPNNTDNSGLFPEYRKLSDRFNVRLLWAARNSLVHMEMADGVAYAARTHNKQLLKLFAETNIPAIEE